MVQVTSTLVSCMKQVWVYNMCNCAEYKIYTKLFFKRTGWIKFLMKGNARTSLGPINNSVLPAAFIHLNYMDTN